MKNSISKARLSLLLITLTAGLWSVSAVATNVIFSTPLGDFEVELFDEQAPGTVSNFLNYVNDGDYVDSFVHRSVPGFVIQGGGFTFVDGGPLTIPADPTIQNEPGISNTRGTIAMAKLGGQPDSATSQWFINTGDNPDLDTSNGGFTVFGQVVGDGMEVVDAIGDLTIWNAGGAFAELPLIDFPGGSAVIATEHLVFTQVSVVSDFTISAGLNDAWVTAQAPFQGMFVTVFESLGLVFAAWFTFDSDLPSMGEIAEFGAADQRWVTAVGSIDGNRAVLSAELTSGGQFNTSNPLPSQTADYGTITLEFSDCSNGLVNFDFPDAAQTGEFAITRVLDSNVANCEAGQAAQ